MSDGHRRREGAPLLIMIPVFNDWEALRLLLMKLDGVLAAGGVRAEVLIVNDGSSMPEPANLLDAAPAALDQIRKLDLLRNLGHQRAIAVGLAFVNANVPCRAVVLMDGDGEDTPEDALRLVAEFDRQGGRAVVFAGRARRSESFAFVVFYHLFKIAHRVLTGHKVEVGNFSVLPRDLLCRLVVVSELWNHYAAAVYKARLPRHIVPTHRGPRLFGRSTMNFPSLVTHGLSAISVFGEVVGARLLIAAGGLILLAMFGVGAVLYLKLMTQAAIPGWATTAVGVLAVLLMQAVTAAVIFIFTILNARQGTSFLPIRDYGFFCGEVRRIYPS